MKHRIKIIIYAAAILLNGIVAVWWGVLSYAAAMQHDFDVLSRDSLMFVFPVAAILAVVALILRLQN